VKEKKDNIFRRLYYGLWKENPILVLCLGLCPTLAVSTTAAYALAMGAFTTAVLILTNVFVSALKKIIPKEQRLLGYLLLAASFTVAGQLFLKAYFPDFSEALGIFIPLTAVNGVIYDRAERCAYVSNPGLALFDGIGTGIGYTFIITLLGAIREIIAFGTIFGIRLIPADYTISFTALAPGACIILAFIMALANKIRGGHRS